MGLCVDKLPHSCGASRALQVFQQEDGSVDGYCFSCGETVDDPYGDKPTPEFKPHDPEKEAADLREVVSYPTVDLPSRKLRAESLRHFGCRMSVSETDGTTPTAVYFPYGPTGKLTGWKVTTLPNKGQSKRIWVQGTTTGANLFGWGAAIKTGQRTLYITEGEYDAVALYQILKDSNRNTEYADQDPAVVSVRQGCKSAKRDIARLQGEISKYFEEVVLVFDMDEPGQEAAEEVCKIAPSYKVAQLPCKDANACLLEGRSKACKAAVVFRSARPKNSRVVRASSLHEAARSQAAHGLSTPWNKLTQATRGFRRGETYYWGAGVKMGKSELVNAIAAHMISVHKTPVYLAKPEEALNKSYKMLAGKMVGKIFHDPNVPFDYDAYDQAGDMIGDLAFFTDVYQFLGWDALKEDIKYTVVENDVHDVIIDPVTSLSVGMSASETNEFLTQMAAEVSAMAKDLDFTAHLFCHLKAPDSTPHERGGQVLSTQFTGSRAMMRSCNYMIGMEGNKDPDLAKEQRNMRTLKILEDREFGVSDTIQLYWDDKTGLFNEIYD